MSKIDVTISGKWPDSESYISDALVENIINVFLEMTEQTSFPKLLIINEPTRKCPMVNFEKVGDQTLIFLSSIRGNLWAKIAYQLSHELCHVHANFSEQQCHAFKWLEESICELASYCNVRKMSHEWAQRSPLPFMASYAPSLNQYVQDIISGINPQSSFVEWLASNLDELKADQYLREKNKIVALNLMPIFTKDNKAWQAVGFLNKWPVKASDSLSDYIGSWEAACPDNLKPTVREIGLTLGATVA